MSLRDKKGSEGKPTAVRPALRDAGAPFSRMNEGIERAIVAHLRYYFPRDLASLDDGRARHLHTVLLKTGRSCPLPLEAHAAALLS